MSKRSLRIQRLKLALGALELIQKNIQEVLTEAQECVTVQSTVKASEQEQERQGDLELREAVLVEGINT